MKIMSIMTSYSVVLFYNEQQIVVSVLIRIKVIMSCGRKLVDIKAFFFHEQFKVVHYFTF